MPQGCGCAGRGDEEGSRDASVCAHKSVCVCELRHHLMFLLYLFHEVQNHMEDV